MEGSMEGGARKNSKGKGRKIYGKRKDRQQERQQINKKGRKKENRNNLPRINQLLRKENKERL